MNGERTSQGKKRSAGRLAFFGLAILLALVFCGTAIIEGFNSDSQMREGNIFSPLGITLIVLSVICVLGGIILPRRKV